MKLTGQLVHARPIVGRNETEVVIDAYGQHSAEKSPVAQELQTKWEAWKRLGVKASEMESAALFVVAAALGCRCGTCLHVVWNQEREKAGLDQDMSEDTEMVVRVAVEGLKLLIGLDRAEK